MPLSAVAGETRTPGAFFRGGGLKGAPPLRFWGCGGEKEGFFWEVFLGPPCVGNCFWGK